MIEFILPPAILLTVAAYYYKRRLRRFLIRGLPNYVPASAMGAGRRQHSPLQSVRIVV